MSTSKRFSILYAQVPEEWRYAGAEGVAHQEFVNIDDISGGEVKDFILSSPMLRNAVWVYIDHYNGSSIRHDARFRVSFVHPTGPYRIEWVAGPLGGPIQLAYSPKEVYQIFKQHYPEAVGGRRRRRRSTHCRRSTRRRSTRRSH